MVSHKILWFARAPIYMKQISFKRCRIKSRGYVWFGRISETSYSSYDKLVMTRNNAKTQHDCFEHTNYLIVI